MAKIFDFAKAYPDSQAIAVPDVTWFRKNQKFLLWMANWSPEGQKLLKMEQTTLTRIDEIWPNRVSQYNLDGSITTDFRVGCKWTNLINFQWEWVQEMARQYQQMTAAKECKNLWNVPVFGFMPALGATGTYYPQAGSGGSNVTCDGYGNQSGATNVSWATIIGYSSGNFNLTATDDSTYIEASGSGQTNKFNSCCRSFLLFDTSSLGNCTINSATQSGYGSNKFNYGFTTTKDLNIYSASPAAYNTLSGTDYSSVGSTAFSTTIEYSSWSTSAYNNFALNASGLAFIKTSGVTAFSMRAVYHDVSGNTPSPWGAGNSCTMECRSADYTGTSSDPKLVVDYTPSPFIPRNTITI